MKESKEDLLYLAKLAEQAERYDGNCYYYIFIINLFYSSIEKESFYINF